MRLTLRRTFLAVLAALTLTAAGRGYASVEIAAIDGRMLKPFEPAGAAGVLFFVATDCPISNSYVPEIQRVCRDYAARGVSCTLIYEDLDIAGSSGARKAGSSDVRKAGSSKGAATPTHALDSAVRAHLREYGYGTMTAAVDRARTISTHAKASITPQAVVVDRRGEVRYRGRIDNFYAALGKPRQVVTEHDLRNALEDVLAGRPVKTPETKALGCHIVDPDFLRK